ncbi:MAG: phage-shock protein [Desulfobacterales bacterium]
MQGAFITAIIFGGIVMSLVVAGATILMGIRLIKGGISREAHKTQAEDAAMIQEIYQKLTQIEDRADALETILFDKHKGRSDDETR